MKRNIVCSGVLMMTMLCVSGNAAEYGVAALLETARKNNPDSIGTAQQVVLVIAAEQTQSTAMTYVLEYRNNRWELVMTAESNIGRTGFAEPGQKREGDGKSPSGIFPLESAFGYAPKADTRMPYQQATPDDFWIDDPESPLYNTWVRGKHDAKSWEDMRRKDDLYKYGMVIGYNRKPVVKGHGSAIFMHVWKEKGKPTAGCVSLDEADLVTLLKHLDPDKKPVIVMGTRETIESWLVKR